MRGSHLGRSALTTSAVLSLLVLVLLTLGSRPARAADDPVWNIDLHHSQTNFPPGGTARYWVSLANVGGAATTGTITVTVRLPAGLTRDSVSVNFGSVLPWSCPGTPGATTIVCTSTASMPRHGHNDGIVIAVNVAPGADGDRFTTATVTGGGAAAPASTFEVTHIGATPADFGIVDGTFTPDFVDADGITSVRQAGSHPDDFVVPFDFTSVDAGVAAFPFLTKPAGNLRNLTVDLPPGFLGDPTAVGECDSSDLLTFTCPVSSQVGTIHLITFLNGGNPAANFHFATVNTGVFNLAKSRGAVTDLGFVFAGNPVHIRASLDASRNYAIKTTVSDVNETAPVFAQRLDLWGVPADPSHDSERCKRYSDAGIGDTTDDCPSDGPNKAFLTTPANCTDDMSMTIRRYDTWTSTGIFGPPLAFDFGQFTDCEASQTEFHPVVSTTPSNSRAGAPTGLKVDADIPFNDDPNGTVPPPVRRLVTTLPEGMRLNPSSADGLEACSEAQVGISHDGTPNDDPVRCPNGSRVGSIELSTPLLPVPADMPANCPGTAPLQGSVYLAEQNANPVHSTFAIYVVVHDCEDRGVLVKLAGKLELDPVTGRITTVFDELPQFPVDHLSVTLRGGEHAPLVNPPTCGTKTSTTELHTYAAPDTDVPADSTFEIDRSITGGPCVPSGFTPSLGAGSTNPTAGASAPFIASFARQDGERDLKSIRSIRLPEGLLGRVSSVPLCDGAAADAGSCPTGSRIGHVQAAAGAGSSPLWVPQAGKAPTSVSLTGPYRGAPYGLSVVVPAQAGPFDLGKVVVRSALHVDRRTARLSTGVDEARIYGPDGQLKQVLEGEMPTILEGIPLQVRELRVIVDREGFIVNPTDCSEQQVTAEAVSVSDATAGLGNRFRVGHCARLGFKPKLAMQLTGKGRTKTGAHPGLKSILTQPAGQANIARAQVTLPKSVVLDPRNSTDPKLVCDYDKGQAADCPASSVIGKATARTPLLRAPLSGDVHLVQGIRFGPTGNRIRTTPTLLVKLRGEVAIDLRARTTVKGNKLVTIFDEVPDAQVSRFDLQINGGRKGILVITRTAKSNINICNGKQLAAIKTNGQNGRQANYNTRIKTPCTKKKAAKKKAKRKAHKK